MKCFSSCAAILLLVHAVAVPSVSSTRTPVDRSFLRKMFKCPACQLNSCAVPEGYPGCELALEPGVCACCPVCARLLGDFCGLTAGRCGKGLACRPLPDDPEPLGAILYGRAVCM
ncbi:insulin-like growth factor-binding protein 2 [Babylonia areolata]|uniref:insulin-like growth factor-binding protein 2 n=1 Tax=Babylonia areolata TaxID=304850 RepID=UPI003FD6436F